MENRVGKAAHITRHEWARLRLPNKRQAIDDVERRGTKRALREGRGVDAR
jgi:hypothetical protein